MKKNGFTLIELLAVIVILAIIALIATPIILGIINDAREKANERSVELYASAVRNAVASYQLTNPNAPKLFSDLNVEYDGDVECSINMLYSDGNFYLGGCKVNGSEKEYSYGIKNPMCTLDDKDSNGIASLSDIVTCGTESFYVMYNKNNEITMLSMYNLYVGNNVLVDERHLPIKIESLENPTNKQSELAKATVSMGNTTYYGTVAFSTNLYWVDDYLNVLPEIKTTWLYNENTSIYQYISEYQRILKDDLGVSSAVATLISYEQVNDLKTNFGNPSWLYLTSYWTGSLNNSDCVWAVNTEGDFWGEIANIDRSFGARPVITISISELQ